LTNVLRNEVHRSFDGQKVSDPAMYFNQKLVSRDVLGYQVADDAVPKAILVSRHHPIAGASANLGKVLVHQLMDTARIHHLILPCQDDIAVRLRQTSLP